jgi:hypothetical protein
MFYAGAHPPAVSTGQDVGAALCLPYAETNLDYTTRIMEGVLE